MIIRKGKLTDLKQILALLKETPELQGTDTNIDPIYNKEYVLDYIENKKMNLVLVAEEKKELVGFILAELWIKKKFAFMADIVVKKGYRKKGVGAKLFKNFEEYCKTKGIDLIVCLVQTKNKNMHRFCAKKGLKRGHSLYHYQKKI